LGTNKTDQYSLVETSNKKWPEMKVIHKLMSMSCLF
jgi:hypothetical protein